MLHNEILCKVLIFSHTTTTLSLFFSIPAVGRVRPALVALEQSFLNSRSFFVLIRKFTRTNITVIDIQHTVPFSFALQDRVKVFLPSTFNYK